MEFVATAAGVIGVIIGIVALAWSHKALVAARDANNLAKTANGLAEEANELAKEGNNVARTSLEIESREHRIREFQALKDKRFEDLWPLVEATTNSGLPSTSPDVAEEWESSIKNLANDTRIAWKNIDPRDPPEELPATPDEVRAAINEFYERTGIDRRV